MQVVYSGGSTPTPSPRVQRKHHPGPMYGRPIFLGHGTCKANVPNVPRTASKDRKDSQNSESSLRDSIPAMVKPVAITCLILNIVLPGLGKEQFYSLLKSYDIVDIITILSRSWTFPSTFKHFMFLKQYNTTAN